MIFKRLLLFTALFVLACISFVSCSDEDKDEPQNEVSIIGLWNENGFDDVFEFQKNGRGIFYEDLSNMSNVECFDYTYNASAGTIVMKWHKDTGKPNWDSPIVETWNGTVKVLSNDKVIVIVDKNREYDENDGYDGYDGYTMILTRLK